MTLALNEFSKAWHRKLKAAGAELRAARQKGDKEAEKAARKRRKLVDQSYSASLKLTGLEDPQYAVLLQRYKEL